MVPASTAPKNGDINTATERTTARIPTPIRNARDIPECWPEKPSIILAIPLIRKAIPMNIIIVMAAATGKDIAIAANIRTSTPSPIVDHLDFLGEKIPTIISSIPTKNKTIASNQTNETWVTPGNARANIDRAIVRIPKPICTALSQPGDFCGYILLYIRDSTSRHKNIKILNLEKSSIYQFLCENMGRWSKKF
jgi:hypothetical protein